MDGAPGINSRQLAAGLKSRPFKAETYSEIPLGAAAARADWMKRARSAGSLRPGEDSMPLEASTPQGMSWAIAWATFSGVRPPATIRCTAAGADAKRARAAGQSNGTPVPPSGRAHLRVDQDAAGEPEPGDALDLSCELRGGGFCCGTDRPVQGLDDAQRSFEFFREPLGQRPIETAVELHCCQAGLVRDGCDLPGVARVEDADALDVGRKVRSDCGDLRGRYLARAGGKDEAEGVRAELGGERGVFEVGVAADLYPHGIVSFGGTQPPTVESIILLNRWLKTLRDDLSG